MRSAAAGASVTRARPTDVHAARHAAREAATCGRYDAVVAAGGDGTIRQVAAALLGADTPLGIVPVGTGNVLAHEIGLAPNAGAIAHMLLHGPAASVMCAHANKEPFLLMAGAGFDGRVIAALDHRFKSYVGKAAYAGPILGALVRPVDVLTVTIDGSRHEASWAVIANARHYGGRFVLAPHTGIRERGLQAVLFKARNRAVLIGQVLSLVMGSSTNAPRPMATSRCSPAPPQRSPRITPCPRRSTAIPSAPRRSRSNRARRSCASSYPSSPPSIRNEQR